MEGDKILCNCCTLFVNVRPSTSSEQSQYFAEWKEEGEEEEEEAAKQRAGGGRGGGEDVLSQEERKCNTID